jgi:hypothetical protein
MAADAETTGSGLTDSAGSIEPQPPMINTQARDTQFFIDIISPLNITLPFDTTPAASVTSAVPTVADWTPLWRAVKVKLLAITVPLNNVATPKITD